MFGNTFERAISEIRTGSDGLRPQFLYSIRANRLVLLKLPHVTLRKTLPILARFGRTYTGRDTSFVVRRAEAISCTVYKSQESKVAFCEFLELEWVQIKAKNDVKPLNFDVRFGRVRLGIPPDIEVQKFWLHH